MRKDNFSDEELLAFTIGDCEEGLAKRISEELSSNNSLRQRLEVIALIKGEVAKSPVEFQIKKSKLFLIFSRNIAFASILFFVGFYLGSYKPSGVSTELISNEKVLSTQLNWDESQFLSLM